MDRIEFVRLIPCKNKLKCRLRRYKHKHFIYTHNLVEHNHFIIGDSDPEKVCVSVQKIMQAGPQHDIHEILSRGYKRQHDTDTNTDTDTYSEYDAVINMLEHIFMFNPDTPSGSMLGSKETWPRYIHGNKWWWEDAHKSYIHEDAGIIEGNKFKSHNIGHEQLMSMWRKEPIPHKWVVGGGHEVEMNEYFLWQIKNDRYNKIKYRDTKIDDVFSKKVVISLSKLTILPRSDSIYDVGRDMCDTLIYCLNKLNTDKPLALKLDIELGDTTINKMVLWYCK